MGTEMEMNSEKWYQALYEEGPSMYFTVDTDGKTLSINKFGAEQLGYKVEELVGQSILKVIYEDDKEIILKEIAECLHDPRYINVQELRKVRRDGSIIWVKEITRAIRIDGDSIVVLIVCEEITDRKQVEEELRKSGERFRQIAESADEWIWEVDADGLYTYSSPVIEKILGCSPEEIVGTKHFYDFFAPDVREDLKKVAFETFARKESFKRFVNPNVHKNGNIVILETSGLPVLDERGNLSGYRGTDTDITEHKRIDETIYRREQEFRALVENAPDIIARFDKKLRHTYINKVIEHKTGIPRSSFIGKTNRELGMPENIVALWDNALQTVFKTGKEQITESDFPTPGGKAYFESHLVPEFARDGSVESVLLISRDITERKLSEEALRKAYDELELRVRERTAELTKANEALQAEIAERRRIEEHLRESEEKFRNLIESIPVGILVTTPEMRIIEINPAAWKILGYSSKEEFQKVPPSDHWYDPKDREQFYELAKKGEAHGFEARFKRKDGTVIWCSMTLTAQITAAGTTQLINVFQDITERKRAEKALQQSEERFSKAFRSSPVALNIARLADGRFVDVNESFLRMFEYSHEEVIGHTSTELNMYVDPNERAQIIRILLEQGTIRNYEVILRTKTGKLIRVLFSAEKISLNDQDHTISTLVDITERKRAEEELRRRTEDLARANAELEQFVYIAAHDLQEPLRMISIFAQLLERRYKGKLDKDVDEFIIYIVDGAKHMQQMIEDLLKYSRIGTRGKPFEPVDFEAVFNQAVTNLKVTIEENRAQITHDPLPTVMADASQMIELFQNLIDNAIKFRREEPPRIHVSSQKKENEWIFSVRDNGIGISPEFMGRLFKIFQREHVAKYPGTGVGLAICRRIVERHGGRIWAESEVGRGSTLYFTIPARREGRQ